MEITYQKELDKIKKIIKERPHGITTKEIAKKIGINRNVVAKYLDVLQISGDVEVERFGRSKVYFPSRSIPISKVIDFSNDFIVVVRKDMTAVEINNPFIKYLGSTEKRKYIGKKISNTPIAESVPKMTNDILQSLEKQEVLEDTINYKADKKLDKFDVKFVPTALKDGEQGVTIILSKKEHK